MLTARWLTLCGGKGSVDESSGKHTLRLPTPKQTFPVCYQHQYTTVYHNTHHNNRMIRYLSKSYRIASRKLLTRSHNNDTKIDVEAWNALQLRSQPLRNLSPEDIVSIRRQGTPLHLNVLDRSLCCCQQNNRRNKWYSVVRCHFNSHISIDGGRCWDVGHHS